MARSQVGVGIALQQLARKFDIIRKRSELKKSKSENLTTGNNRDDKKRGGDIYSQRADLAVMQAMMISINIRAIDEELV
jgi:hypothetical protein